MNEKAKDIEAIRQLAEAWRAGWLSGDVDALLALYAEQPAVLPHGQPAITDKDAIGALYRQVFREYGIASEARVVEIEVSGDLGYLWSTYRLTATPKAGGPAIQEQGKTLFIVRRQADGAWRISRLIDNSDRPATEEPA